MALRDLVLAGVGQVSRAVIKQAGDLRKITGTTRDPRKIFELVSAGITPLIMPLPSAEVFESVCVDADVLISFPPDGETDKILAPGVRVARRVIYLSSTGVYGSIEGTIDDTTPIDPDHGENKRVEAEKIWQSVGAIVLRVPGIYGTDSGLHLSLKSGKYRLPGDGDRYSSRIHVDDLATIIMAVFSAEKLERNCYVVGDLSPCTQREVTTWLCEKLELPLPESIPLDQAHRTLRGNRQVNPRNLLHELGIELRYPDYKAGFTAILG